MTTLVCWIVLLLLVVVSIVNAYMSIKDGKYESIALSVMWLTIISLLMYSIIYI